MNSHVRLHCAIDHHHHFLQTLLVTRGLRQQRVLKAERHEGTMIQHNRWSRAFKERVVGLWVQHDALKTACLRPACAAQGADTATE